MDQALLRLSHMHKGTYYVQICDKIINHRDIERYQSGLINNIMELLGVCMHIYVHVLVTECQGFLMARSERKGSGCVAPRS
jgi:hypothetical protein